MVVVGMLVAVGKVGCVVVVLHIPSAAGGGGKAANWFVVRLALQRVASISAGNAFGTVVVEGRPSVLLPLSGRRMGGGCGSVGIAGAGAGAGGSEGGGCTTPASTRSAIGTRKSFEGSVVGGGRWLWEGGKRILLQEARPRSCSPEQLLVHWKRCCFAVSARGRCVKSFSSSSSAFPRAALKPGRRDSPLAGSGQ